MNLIPATSWVQRRGRLHVDDQNARIWLHFSARGQHRRGRKTRHPLSYYVLVGTGQRVLFKMRSGGSGAVAFPPAPDLWEPPNQIVTWPGMRVCSVELTPQRLCLPRVRCPAHELFRDRTDRVEALTTSSVARTRNPPRAGNERITQIRLSCQGRPAKFFQFTRPPAHVNQKSRIHGLFGYRIWIQTPVLGRFWIPWEGKSSIIQAKILRSGRRSRRFESSHPDQAFRGLTANSGRSPFSLDTGFWIQVFSGRPTTPRPWRCSQPLLSLHYTVT